MGNTFSEEILNWPDTVIFGRTYYQGHDPLKAVAEFKKRGKRILYDMDDDFWEVAKHNPSVVVSNALKDQYESFARLADAIITPSTVLAKKFKKHFKKPTFICPNGIDINQYSIPTFRDPVLQDKLVIGYMGGSSHWKDLGIIIEAIEELSTRHDFIFSLFGLTPDPIDQAVYVMHKALEANVRPEQNPYFQSAIDFYSRLQKVNMMHLPFIIPELHPYHLSRACFDIGLAPLEDTKFNHAKSCIKFYEYAAVGAVTVASDVMPYSDEVNYLAKNKTKDWVKKIEKLIVDKEFREKIRKQQYDWVMKNRTVQAKPDDTDPMKVYPGIGLPWELACQREGGLKVHNQETDGKWRV